MNKKLIIGLIVAGVVIAGGVYLYNQNKKGTEKKNNVATNKGDANTQKPSKDAKPKYKAKYDIMTKYEYNTKGELTSNDISGGYWIKQGTIVTFEKVTINNVDYLKDGNKYYNINNFELVN